MWLCAPPGTSHPEQAGAMGALPMGGLSLGDTQPPAIHRESQALPPPPPAIGMMVTSNFPPCPPLQDGRVSPPNPSISTFPFTHQGWAGVPPPALCGVSGYWPEGNDGTEVPTVVCEGSVSALAAKVHSGDRGGGLDPPGMLTRPHAVPWDAPTGGDRALPHPLSPPGAACGFP